MTEQDGQITVGEVAYTIIPRLKTTERMIDHFLRGRLRRCTTKDERARLESLSVEFQLEFEMIRLNLEHLLSRYSLQFEGALNPGSRGRHVLALDEHEVVAISSARKLFQRARGLE